MNYKEYQNARDVAWLILIHEQIKELPIDIIRICKNLGIEVKYDANLAGSGNDGRCTIIKRKPYIFVNPACDRQRKRFTIAHELGHILLNHVGKYELVNREPSSDDNPIEQAANVFASRLLAPACVLWGCNARTATDISVLCDISYKSATYRMERMQTLYARNKFLTSPLEKIVFQQFSDFISRQHQA